MAMDALVQSVHEDTRLIIATVTAFIIVSVIWAENYDQIYSMVLQ